MTRAFRLAIIMLLGWALSACSSEDEVGPGGVGGTQQVGAAIVDIVVEETAGGAAEVAPVTFGHAFVAGDAPQTVVVTDGEDVLPTQVDVKRRHADDSVRHAIITVQVPALGAAERRTLTIKAAGEPTPPPTGLTADQALAGFDCALVVTDGDGKHVVDVAALLADEAAERWLDGSLVTELRSLGSVPGVPAMSVQVDARFAAPGQARVSIAVDNAWHDAPGNLTYDVAIESAGEAVLSQTGVEHYHHARWRHVHHAGGEPPAVRVIHDLDYLIATGAIPRYDTSRAVTAQAVDKLTESWASANTELLGPGIVMEYFPTTGGRGDIGPLPMWAALALLSQDAGAMVVTHGVGDLAGSFSVHYRDRDTRRPISLDDWPTISLIAAAAKYSEEEDKLPECTNCSSPYTVDAAHQPSLAFLPYLLTGDAYYLDELYFWNSYNFIAQNWDYRGEDEGLLEHQQVRAQAWTLRTLAHTAWIAPQAHPEAAYLEAKLQNNFDWYAANAPGSNPFGWWGEQSNWDTDGGRPDDNMDPDVRYYCSPWQSDFLIWAFDYAMGLGYADAAAARDWLAQFVVGRFTNGPDYNPFDGAPYHIATSSVSGAQYSSWAQLWQMSFAGRTDPPPTELPSASCALCYPAIARVALTGAIHAELADAQAAWDFVDGELNKHDEIYDDDPTWAILP